MASKQTRRSISVSISCYERLKERCDRDGTSMSGVVEELVRAALGMEARDLKPRPAIKVSVKKPGVMVVTTKELAPATKWVAAPSSRVAVIKTAAEAHVAFKPTQKAQKVKEDVAKAAEAEVINTAGGIFTF